MNATILTRLTQLFFAGIFLVLCLGCEREITDLEKATNPTNPEVFINGFSAGLEYAAFGGSVPTAFDVDNEVTYNNSTASMRFEVPNAGDPRGTYAGGVFFTEGPRDLSGFNVLTFWAKASQAVSIGEIGFGNDLGANKFVTSIQGLTLSTGWQKYIIPIPDPSKLTAERGLFWYAAGNIDGKGFSFWIDEVKYQNLGTIAHGQFSILHGENQTATSFEGVTTNIGGLSAIFNMPSGINRSVNIAPAYFEFSSSDETIATVDQTGLVTVTGGPGDAEITATVGETDANGSLTIQSMGAFEQAPTPTHPAENVISIFSDHYDNVPVDYYNGYWEPWQTTESADFEINGNHILHYTNFNFVGIQFSSPTINATDMTHMHMNIYLPGSLPANGAFKIELVDNADDGRGVYTHTIPAGQSQQWLTLNIPLSSFAGLSNKANLFQLIFVNDSDNISSFYADNIYFYK